MTKEYFLFLIVVIDVSLICKADLVHQVHHVPNIGLVTNPPTSEQLGPPCCNKQ